MEHVSHGVHVQENVTSDGKKCLIKVKVPTPLLGIVRTLICDRKSAVKVAN